MNTRTNPAIPAFAASLCLAAAAGLTGLQRSVPARPPEPDPAPALIERGRYLVHDVAMCVQCHSPRDENGNLLEGALLTGAPMPVRSPFPGRDWAMRTPNLRGMMFLSDEQALHLLCDGIAHTGRPPDPPMPPFRMTRDDASAVIAYLRSLR